MDMCWLKCVYHRGVTPPSFLPEMHEAQFLLIFLGPYRKLRYIFALFALKCSAIIEP